ncbi:MAG: dap4 3 [Planctomycetota bacterium]|nr:dap4 3 [Planctomycetota bacterium]
MFFGPEAMSLLRRVVLSSTAVVLGLVGVSRADEFDEPSSLMLQGGPARGRVFKDRLEPHWFDKGDRLWYRNDLAGGVREFLVVDAIKRERKPAFDHARLAEKLAKATEMPTTADHLPLDAISFEDDGTLRFKARGKGWRYDTSKDKLESADPPPSGESPSVGPQNRRNGRRPWITAPGARSPDGKWTAFLKDHNLHVRATEGAEVVVLSTEGTEADAYGSGVFWSPDSKKVVALQTAKAESHKVYLIGSSPVMQVQPRLTSHEYLKPGDRIAVAKPHLFDLESRKEIPIKEDLFANPWSLDGIRWSPDSSRFTFLFNQRGHQVLRIVSVNAETGEAKSLIDEKSDTFVDYSNKTFVMFLDKTNEILWMSERDGWNHLYLIDANSGNVKNPITRGEWVVRDVERVDEETRQVWFRAMGIRPGQDPYHIHHARVNFDGSGLVVQTEGDGTHEIRYSPDRRYFLDTYSRVDLAPVHELRKEADGSLVCPLEKADISEIEKAGWKPPERFVARARDGRTDIHGIIQRPSTIDRSKKYPIIEQIYAGPHGAFVPKSFQAGPLFRSLTDLGFVVVQIDGMGTNWRSKAFHDVCWKNLADAGFPDRILWMKATAEKYPYLDLSRVGIYGGSAGGQNALAALLWHGDFYKAAVADCGCHDNRMDKIWWNEAWMGWPVGPHYEESSNVVNAHKLKGKLLLTVGEMDHNVDPASTMQVVNALIKADKDFELIVFPGSDHGAGSGPYGQRRLRDFFVRHLQGAEPGAKPSSPEAKRSDE